MKRVTGVLCLQLLIILLFKTVNGWLWQCDFQNRFCKRIFNGNGDEPTYATLDMCHLICGRPNNLNIWPYPTGATSSSAEIVLIDPHNIEFEIRGHEETKPFLETVIVYFKDKIMTDQQCCKSSLNMKVILNPVRSNVSLTLDTDESYTLQMGSREEDLNVQIVGNTVFGVRHGIETLLQLLVPYEENNRACLATYNYLKISDKPVYRHRGLLLDSARNFLSIDTIKKNIDGMAASKMNVLHWHITDSQSFPLYLPSLPNMTRYGAYSEKSIYKPDDITDLVEYAKTRGVRILIEIDGPSHAGSGWQWGPEAGIGNLSVCINQQPWRNFCIQPPCGQLNPANPKMYKTLHTLYKDIAAMIPDADLFHMGGDEVYIPCWNATKEIINYLKNKPATEETFLDLWGEYHRKALEAYDLAVDHNRTSVVVWTSHLTDPGLVEKYYPKNRYIIHTWIPIANESLITNYLNLGYKVIISTKDRWYLDHGFWGSTPFYTWRKVYENKMYIFPHPNILGGEVCMWGELVDDNNIESRVWPRAAAAAERLWTNPTTNSVAAESRFFSHSERLLNRGIKAEIEIPEWCTQNEGECLGYL